MAFAWAKRQRAMGAAVKTPAISKANILFPFSFWLPCLAFVRVIGTLALERSKSMSGQRRSSDTHTHTHSCLTEKHADVEPTKKKLRRQRIRNTHTHKSSSHLIRNVHRNGPMLFKKLLRTCRLRRSLLLLFLLLLVLLLLVLMLMAAGCLLLVLLQSVTRIAFLIRA